MEFILSWLPEIAVLPIVLSGMRRKRFAIPLILIVYYLVLFLAIIIPTYLSMTNSGVADPQLTAGAISEGIITGVLASLISLPILYLIWFLVRKAKIKRA